jgi:hypothetical protein
LFDRQYCDPGYTNVAGVCWQNCPDGYVDNGAFCSKGGEVKTKGSYGRGAGTPDTQINTKASYGRTAGTPDTTINPKGSYGRTAGYVPLSTNVRAKQRKVPYSTKNN